MIVDGTATPWTKYTATIGGLSCAVLPVIENGHDTETWSVSIEGFTVVKATDDLEHALGRCVSFAKEADVAI